MAKKRQVTYPRQIEKGIRQTSEMSFQVRIQRAGHRVEKTFDTLAEARAFRDLHNASMALSPDEAAIYEAREKKRAVRGWTVADALDKYRQDISRKKKGWKQEGAMLDRLGRMSIAIKPAYAVSVTNIRDLLDELRTSQKPNRQRKAPAPLSDATLRRYFNLVRHVFQCCVDWGKIEKNPAAELPRSQRPRDGQPRDRRLLGDEYERLLGELDGEARAYFILAVETGMRRSEALALEWQRVDLSADDPHASIPDTKTKEPRTVPLSSRARAALLALAGDDDKVVKIRRGKVFSLTHVMLRHRWKKACAAIGSPGLRIHDLRHEATSRLFERGLNVIEAAGITGHKSLAMLNRYSHLHRKDILKKLG